MGWRDALPNLVAFGDAFTPPPEALDATEAPPEGLGASSARPQDSGSLLESLLAGMLPDTGQMVHSGEGFQDPGAVRRSQLRDLFKTQTGRDPRSSPNMLRLADGTRVLRDARTGEVRAQADIRITPQFGSPWLDRETRRKPDGTVVELPGGPQGRAVGFGPMSVADAEALGQRRGPAASATITNVGGPAPTLTPAQLAEAQARFAEIDRQQAQVTPDLLRALTGAAALGRGTPEATRTRLGLTQAAAPEVGVSELARLLLLAESESQGDRGKQDVLLPRILERGLGEARERREKASIRAEARAGRIEDREDRQAQQRLLAEQVALQRRGLQTAEERDREARALEAEVDKVLGDVAKIEKAVRDGEMSKEAIAPAMLRSIEQRVPEALRPAVAKRLGITLPTAGGPDAAGRREGAITSALIKTLGQGARRGTLGFAGSPEALSLNETRRQAEVVLRVLSQDGSFAGLGRATARAGLPTIDVDALKAVATQLAPAGTTDDETLARILAQAIEQSLQRIGKAA